MITWSGPNRIASRKGLASIQDTKVLSSGPHCAIGPMEPIERGQRLQVWCRVERDELVCQGKFRIMQPMCVVPRNSR